MFFFFKQKTAYEMRISDWSSDVCSSDLSAPPAGIPRPANSRPSPVARSMPPYRLCRGRKWSASRRGGLPSAADDAPPYGGRPSTRTAPRPLKLKSRATGHGTRFGEQGSTARIARIGRLRQGQAEARRVGQEG